MNKSNNKYRRKSKSRSNCGTENSNSNKTSKLCSFSSIDYIVLASTLAIALGEELSNEDVNILATFFAVLSDELALIASVEACSNNDDDNGIFTAPTPDVAVTSSINKKNIKKKK